MSRRQKEEAEEASNVKMNGFPMVFLEQDNITNLFYTYRAYLKASR
jgi:hypothetical protein